jgi:hypothetical protein
MTYWLPIRQCYDYCRLATVQLRWMLASEAINFGHYLYPLHNNNYCMMFIISQVTLNRIIISLN